MVSKLAQICRANLQLQIRNLFALDGFCKTQKGESIKGCGGVVNLQTCGKVRVGPFHEAIVCLMELVEMSEQNVREN